MILATSNEKNDLTSAQRRADIGAVYGALSPDPIVLWQEFRDPAHHDDLMAAVPAGTQIAHGNLPVPITVPARYQITASWLMPTKPATGPSSPYAGPDAGSAPRWWSAVQLDDTTNSLPEFVVINTHLTNGCEWDLSWSASSDDARFLRPFWTAHWDLLKAEVDRVKALDLTVFYGGDWNRKQSPPLGDAERLAVGDGKIDKLAVIERSVDAALKATGTVVTQSDHDARWARWDLSKRP